MKFDLLNIEYEPRRWFWITIAEISYSGQNRSLLHIEKNEGLWKFQLLWLANNCWIIELVMNLNRYKMNIIKTLKNSAIYTLLAVCGFAVWYLGTAFVLLEMNFANWEQSIRLLVMLEGAITAFGAISIYKVCR